MGNTALKGEIIKKVFEDDKIYCPDCFSELEKTKENTFYCPNEMCLNDFEYDKFGNVKKEQLLPNRIK